MSARRRGLPESLRSRPDVLLVAATMALLVGLAVHQLAMNGDDLDVWDHMFVSGSVATIIGLWLAKQLPDRFELMLSRLKDRRALLSGNASVSASEFQSLHASLRRLARRVSILVSVCLGAGVGIVWAIVTVPGNSRAGPFDAYAGPAFGAVGGALVGWALGYMLAAGLLARTLRSHRITLAVTPAHPDGAAGLKPLGDYYLYQALLLAFGAAYLAAWSLLILLDITERYDYWLEPYLALLALVICLELATFALPLWSVHRLMAAQRRSRLARADKDLGSRVAGIHERLEGTLAPDERKQLTEQLEHLAASFREAESMPTWPLDQSLRRRLTLSNLLLVVPLVGQVVKLAQ